ncbi:hypothetical protein RIF29_09379 [Crotalaria pallida]|uniref:Uncharacterized protein n=1 Tax=Crotalaria pallida TaxID=3830 RepID=A0AAN9IJM5_CROPI
MVTEISHIVVLGTINVGEQGEGAVPDLSGVCSLLLSRIVHISAFDFIQFSCRCLWDWFALAPSWNETEGTNARNRNLAGNQAQSGPTFCSQAFQSLPQAFQIPMPTGVMPVPSLNEPIPHSLNTLSQFIYSMETTLSQNGMDVETDLGLIYDVLSMN